MFYFDLPVRVLELDKLDYFVQNVLDFEVIILLLNFSTAEQAQVEHIIHLKLDEAC